MADPQESTYTADDVRQIQDEEYERATRRLLADDDFVAFLVRWISEARGFNMRPYGPEELAQLNWGLGRAQLMNDFMASVRVIAPDAASRIEQEVQAYVGRRERAERRDRERESELEPGSGDYEFPE